MAPPLDQRPNHSLIGVPGSRERLATPALVLDIDAFEGNIAAMASWAEKHSLGLRPHAKTKDKQINICFPQAAKKIIG